MKARELAEILMENPDMEIVTKAHSDSTNMYVNNICIEKVKVCRVPSKYSWTGGNYFETDKPIDGEKVIEVISVY